MNRKAIDWVQKHRRELEGYARLFLPTSQQAADVVQELLLRLTETSQLEELDDDSLRKFLYRCVRNLAIDHARKDTRTRRVLEEIAGETEAYTVPSVEGREFLGLLATALDAMNDRSRTILYLEKVEGLPQKDIAPRLGISGPRVCQIKTQNLVELRKSVQDYMGET